MTFSNLHTYLNSPNQTKVRYLTLESSGTEQIDNVIVRGAKTWLTSSSKNVVIPSRGLEYAWIKVIEAEFALSAFLQKYNLLTLPMQKETVQIFKDQSLVAYSYPSFQRLQMEGKYLLDLRQDKASSWKIQKLSLFTNPVNKLKPEIWDPVFTPLLCDIAQLIVLGLPLDPKNHCLAIIKTDNDYVVRYLAQDMAREPKEIKETIAEPNPLIWNERLKDNLESLLTAVLVCEFKRFGLNEEQKELLKKLLDKYVPAILELAKTLYQQRSLRFEYERYKAILKTGASFLITYFSNKQYVEVVKDLAQGADKKLLLLSNGQVLFIPNINCFDPIRDHEAIRMDEIPPTVAAWKKIAAEEVAFSAKLSQLNLLTTFAKPCQLHVDGYKVESYITESFESLARRGIHVVENGFKTCSWLKENLFLFKKEEERKDIANWRPRVELLVRDVVKICKHGLPVNNDALHSAIYRLNDINYIRYFGFDFQKATPATMAHAPLIFESILEPIIKLEFRNSFQDTQQFTRDLVKLCLEEFKSQTDLRLVQSAGT